PTFVSQAGDEVALPGLRSLTSTVPAAVPSLFHSSRPCVPSSAVKNSLPLTSVSHQGYEVALPGLRSLTSTVPAARPSLFHSSRPLTPSCAVKEAVEPITAILNGFEFRVFGLTSRTICGVSDGMTRSSSASRKRGCRRGLARETARVRFVPRSEWHQRCQNE